MLVVTLRTAQSLAARERVNRRCRERTLPHRSFRTAFAIRTCSRHTSLFTARQSTDDQERSEGAPADFTAACRLPSSRRFSKLSRDGAPAGRGLPFGPGTCVPYPARYKPAFASSSILSRTSMGFPCGSLASSRGWLCRNDSGLRRGERRSDRARTGTIPAGVSRALRQEGKIGLDPRSGKGTGFPRSAPRVHAGVGACYRPGATSTARGCRSRPLPDTITFWSKPLSLFGLFSHDGRFTDSLTFTLPAF